MLMKDTKTAQSPRGAFILVPKFQVWLCRLHILQWGPRFKADTLIQQVNLRRPNKLFLGKYLQRIGSSMEPYS